MSLNGLEDAKVKEAHEAAVAEAGGWYVLFLHSPSRRNALCDSVGHGLPCVAINVSTIS